MCVRARARARACVCVCARVHARARSRECESISSGERRDADQELSQRDKRGLWHDSYVRRDAEEDQ